MCQIVLNDGKQGLKVRDREHQRKVRQMSSGCERSALVIAMHWRRAVERNAQLHDKLYNLIVSSVKSELSSDLIDANMFGLGLGRTAWGSGSPTARASSSPTPKEGHGLSPPKIAALEEQNAEPEKQGIRTSTEDAAVESDSPRPVKPPTTVTDADAISAKLVAFEKRMALQLRATKEVEMRLEKKMDTVLEVMLDNRVSAESGLSRRDLRRGYGLGLGTRRAADDVASTPTWSNASHRSHAWGAFNETARSSRVPMSAAGSSAVARRRHSGF